MKLAMLFISHDLSVVRYVSHRIVVLYLGRIVETGTRDQLFARPLHPYTKALIGSVLSADPDVERGRALPSIGGDLPSAIDPPSGCVFRTRCPAATENCATEMPPMRSFTGGHRAACHYIEQDAAA
jgi:oligopeptide transport system ATP-binding protein